MKLKLKIRANQPILHQRHLNLLTLLWNQSSQITHWTISSSICNNKRKPEP